MNAKQRICVKCRYYERSNPNWERGECRRHPPRALDANSDRPNRFPVTKDTDWCGEYQPSDTAETN